MGLDETIGSGGYEQRQPHFWEGRDPEDAAKIATRLRLLNRVNCAIQGVFVDLAVEGTPLKWPWAAYQFYQSAREGDIVGLGLGFGGLLKDKWGAFSTGTGYGWSILKPSTNDGQNGQQQTDQETPVQTDSEIN